MPDTARLPDEARRRLLALARRALEQRLAGGVGVAADEDPPCDQKRGVFVTLSDGGDLRGCIGYPLPIRSLGQAVVDCAIAAAVDDPRFPPVTRAELDRLRIEISVLTVPVDCRPEDVVVGRDGLIVRHGGASGLLLPQVASEHGWDRDTFLEHICRKAGIAAAAWRHGARLQRFQAEVFGETD
jgi:hypothetical protein